MKFNPKQLRMVVPAPKKQDNTMKIGMHGKKCFFCSISIIKFRKPSSRRKTYGC